MVILWVFKLFAWLLPGRSFYILWDFFCLKFSSWNLFLYQVLVDWNFTLLFWEIRTKWDIVRLNIMKKGRLRVRLVYNLIYLWKHFVFLCYTFLWFSTLHAWFIFKSNTLWSFVSLLLLKKFLSIFFLLFDKNKILFNLFFEVWCDICIFHIPLNKWLMPLMNRSLLIFFSLLNRFYFLFQRRSLKRFYFRVKLLYLFRWMINLWNFLTTSLVNNTSRCVSMILCIFQIRKCEVLWIAIWLF